MKEEKIIECVNIFENLTPTDNVNNNGIYECSLKYGLDDENIKNIALSGAYGSGKSSILKTFEKKYKNKYEFLNISLADFSGSEKNNENLDIERSILQKMFYTVRNEEIPFSRFKRIKDITARELEKYSLWLFIGLFWFFIAYKNKNLPEYLWFLKFDVVYIIGFIITFISLYFMLPKIISLFGNMDLKKINLKSGDVDLGQKDDSSILNKNLDEILYFFKATNYDVVIFEDLDRYAKNIDIFVKLREINLILNNSKEVEQNITFIYAIKDDNFKDEERTKFFDLIIPVIPIVDYSNSSEQLKIMIKRHKENMGLNKNILKNSFINDICLYIDNMRLLKNIFNEFVIYNEKLESDNLEKEKLFSMIVYKNLFPDDFSKLSNKKGLVYEILLKKEELINTKIKSINEKITNIENKLEETDNEQIKSIDELKSIYIYHVLKKLERLENKIIYVDNSPINISNLLEDGNFDKLKNSLNIKYDNYYNRNVLDFKVIENDISNKTYDERKILIKNKNKEYTNTLSLEIESLEKEKQVIKTKKLKDLIEDSNSIFGAEFNDKGLLIFLITNGYIDETYSYYISHFYEESITKDDRDFILSIRERRVKDYSFKLEKVDEIIKQIHFYEYDRKEVLNYSLIEYLLEKNNTKILNQIIKQINEKKDLEFIKGYIDTNYKNIDKFVDFIVEKCIWSWDEIDKSSFTIEKKENYLKLILKYGKIENLKKLNISLISEYISNISNFVEFSSDIEIKRIKEILKIFEPAFKKISQIDDKTELFEFIYENDFYEIFFEMIEGILKQFNKNEFNVEDLDKKNLTIIKNSTCKKLITNIEKNIVIYIENVLLNSEKIHDDENVLVELFNNENISDEMKVEIIKKQKTLISNISEITTPKLWKNLFEENKVKVDWNNTLYYYQQYKEIDESLIKYFNIIENAQILSNVRISSKTDFMKNSKFDILLVEELLKKILLMNKIGISSYKLLIKSNAYWYADLDISTLSEEKIIEVVKAGKLQLSIVNFNRLKEYTQEEHIKLIEKNIDGFLDKYDEYLLDEKDILKILENSNISKEIKVEIIQKLDYELISNKNIGILIYKFMNRKIKYSIDFLENLIKNLTTLEMQINIIVEQNQYLNEDEFILLLNLLEKDYSKICNFDGKQTVLKDNYYNKNLIDILHFREFITKDKEDKDKTIRLFIKHRK